MSGKTDKPGNSRDQQHAFFGLATAAGIAEVAWNEGYDVWNSLDNRLLKGFEFMSKYNTTYVASFPDQPTPWEPDNVIQRFDRTGRWFSKQVSPYFEANSSLSRGNFGGRPVYEQAAGHFKVRMGMEDEALWTERGRDTSIALAGYEKAGGNTLDQPGWGALTFRRPALMAGDPISGFENGLPVYSMNVLPATIEAENVDHFPIEGDGHTYHDLTIGNSSGEYRKDSVDVQADGAGGYALTSLEKGEWFTYSVYVPVTGNYRMNVRYAAAAEGGAIRFALNGSDSTNDVILPSTGGAADWKTYTVDDNVPLTAGVQVMRVFIGGDSQAFNLDHITVSNNPSSANYTKGDYYLYQKEVERIEAALAVSGAAKTDLAAEFAAAEALLVPLIGFPAEKVQLSQSMVTASSVSWDNKWSAAQNGWRAYDGDTVTSPDTKTGDGWVMADLGVGNGQEIGKLRFYPRAGTADRMNGALLQGSNDGTKFVSLHTISGVNEYKWYEVWLNTGTAYRYLRYHTPTNGNANVAELEFYKKPVDKTLLPLLLQEAAAADTEFYSQVSTDALQVAMTNAQAVYDNANATRAEIDTAAARFVAALKLVPQEKVQLTQSMVTASSVSWDNKWSAAQNGWRAFDGDTATSSDTKTASGWVRVDLGAGNEQTIGSVKFYPRAGFAGRMNGALIQGSNDGTNFVTLYSISGVSDYKWYKVSINTDTAYRYLRYNTPSGGHANVAELELYKR